MNRRIGWTVGLLLLAVVAVVGVMATIGLLRPGFGWHDVRPAPAAAGAEPPRVTLGYHTEQEWIVWDVTRTLAQIAAFASNGSPRETAGSGSNGSITVTTDPADATTPSAGPRFTITLPGRTPLHVTATDHIWSPAAYEDLARTLLGKTTARGDLDEVPDSTALLTALVDLRTEVLVDQSAQLSTLLTQHPTSAIGHERAALLTGAMMLREAARPFTDVRAELSRMTAHLALAHVLRGNSAASLDGAMADLLLRLGVYHHRDALAQLERMTPGQPSETMRAWQSALRLRITNDWRALERPEHATLIERLEYLRAVRSRLSSSRMLDFLDRFEPEPITDWRRIVLSRSSVSIEAGNRLVGSGTDQELAEATRVWKAFHEGTSSDDRVITDLNAENSGPVQHDRNGRATIQVLGWDLWAPFLQRHLCAQLIFVWRQNRGLGLPEDNQALTRQFAGPFGSLRLFPLVLKQIAWRTADYQRALTGARDLLRIHPDLFTPELWDDMRQKPQSAKEALPFPDKTAWFTPIVPSGTAFDLDMRAFPSGGGHASTEDLERWARISPYNYMTLWNLALRRTGGTPDFEVMRAAYVTVAPYSIGALLKLHEAATTSSQRIIASRPLCDLDVDECDLLGNDLMAAGQDEQAADTLDRYVLQARDSVGMSHNVTWLVRYHEEAGRLGHALDIAQRAADTGSAAGMQTLAFLCDHTGNYRYAERLYERISDRYDDPIELGTFYIRRGRRTQNAEDQAQGVSLLKTPFPRGLESVTLQSFNEPPHDGVRFLEFGERAASIGLHPDDVLVAIDGVRVRTSWQYGIAAKFSHEPLMDVILWRDGRYQELKLTVPQRLFGVRYDTYTTS